MPQKILAHSKPFVLPRVTTPSLLCAHSFTATSAIHHAIKTAVMPIMTVATSIAFRSFSIIASTVSLFCIPRQYHQPPVHRGGICQWVLTLAMSIKPPDIRQNDVTSSDGGRDGDLDLAGAM